MIPALTALLNLASIFWFYRIVATTDVTFLGFGLPASAFPLIGLWVITGLSALISIDALIKTCSILSIFSFAASIFLQILVFVVK